MLKQECHHDCNLNHCPFAQDTRNPNRYVCLKCGVERNINYNRSSFVNFLLLIFALFLAFQVLAETKKQEEQNQQQPTSFSIKDIEKYA